MIDEIIKNSKTKSSYNVEEYKKNKENQRKNCYNIIETGLNKLKTDKDFFKKYIDTQIKFDNYSVKNNILITSQNPNVTLLKDMKSWKELGVNFKNKIVNKILILEPKENGKDASGNSRFFYNAKEVVDISETNFTLENKMYRDKEILQAVLHNTPFLIKAVDDLENEQTCRYDADNNVLYVKRSEDYGLLINNISKELATKNFENKNCNYTKDFANLVGYMICRKYNYELELSNLDNLYNIFSSMSSAEITSSLSDIKESYNDINDGLEKYLYNINKDKEMKNKEIER